MRPCSCVDSFPSLSSSSFLFLHQIEAYKRPYTSQHQTTTTMSFFFLTNFEEKYRRTNLALRYGAIASSFLGGLLLFIWHTHTIGYAISVYSCFNGLWLIATKLTIPFSSYYFQPGRLLRLLWLFKESSFNQLSTQLGILFPRHSYCG